MRKGFFALKLKVELRRPFMDRTYRIDDRTILLDLFFQGRPHIIGAYLLLGDPPALIETGPSSCLPALESGLAEYGLTIADLDVVVVTHIHLDHAGAAGVLARRNRNVRIFVHHVGAPHLVDPSRLLRSAGRIYGDQMGPLWGEVAPVAQDRIVSLQDGATIEIGGRTLRAVDSPGHAYHQHAFLEEDTGLMFTGDAAGVALPGCTYVRPPTPPPELNLEAWASTLHRLMALKPRRLCLTHFGDRDNAEATLAQMKRRIWEYAEVLRPGWESGENFDQMVARFEAQVQPEVEQLCGSETASRFQLAASYRINVLGYIRYFETSRRVPTS